MSFAGYAFADEGNILLGYTEKGSSAIGGEMTTIGYLIWRRQKAENKAHHHRRTAT